MKNFIQIKNVIELICRLQNLCEGFDESSKSVLISAKFKAMLVIESAGRISPSLIIDRIGLAKSNVALLCSGLVEEGLIEREKDELDNRVIFYKLTKSGEKWLEETLEKIDSNFKKQLAYKKKFKEINDIVKQLGSLVE